MLYVFIIMLICSFITEREKLFRAKRNLSLFFTLSVVGIALGVVHTAIPYIPSIAMILEKYLK